MTTMLAPPLLMLRDYQQETIARVKSAWRRGVVRPAVVLPTGTGKTVIFAHAALQWTQEHRSRVVILVHTDELVRQAVAKLHSVAPHLPVGVVKASQNDIGARVIVASVQTLRSEARVRQLADVGLIIVDECHHATTESYQLVLRELGALPRRFVRDPRRTAATTAVAVGFTATMKRSDGAALGDVWQEVVYERSIIEMIQLGHLADVKGRALVVDDFNMSGVRQTAGDYSERDLGEALEDSSAPQVIASAYVEHARDRAGLVFTPTVDTAHLMADTLSGAGIPAAAISGRMPRAERRALIADLSSGRTQVLCCAQLLTEGFDEPRVSCVVVARPTQSAALYIQMVGRALRPYPGKASALVLDVSGASARHSLVGLTTLAGAEVRPDETIVEALEREELEALELDLIGDDDSGGQAPPRLITVKAQEQREIDLFHGIRQAWLRTDAGWWVMPHAGYFVAIIPDDRAGSWAVSVFNPRGGGQYVERDLDSPDYAMAWGEQWIAGQNSQVYSQRAIRARKRKPTVMARRQALAAGVSERAASSAASAGELESLVEQRRASARIDPAMDDWLRRWYARNGVPVE